MGIMVDGVWRSDTWVRDNEGHFQRDPTTFHHQVVDEPGARFTPEAGRYHLYVSYACPWAHRTLIARALLGLEEVIDVSVVHPHMLEGGWSFETDFAATTGDRLHGKDFLREIYLLADPDYSGRVTVPVLWDTKENTIVNNESREIIRMFSTVFAPLGTANLDLAPEALRGVIDERIDAIYEPVNNGVYLCGFATTQEAYEEALGELFDALGHWEKYLGEHRYLVGDTFSEADLCMFTTLLRFDPVYYGHFKCNLNHVYELPNLWNYLLELYQMPGVAQTCHIDHIQQHYYYSHDMINPTRVVPKGPALNHLAAHDRDRLVGELAKRG
ncbi:glutathione S-transferase family protein [Lujinxingia vulgaris]|uniref:Glutathione S-transferase family protein n=1 Tax=Lujinxingia vulgaris TaxID=2600176 RepID=A0A5C6X5H1_9DELT|nr:glutathione S-transferase family protein [Lujinxingia vulgaris]TXD37040.1 glutathione S-transferase family protein [Lujinxingia vulgaris]